jgi:leader peptidase (prepilin peptidase)/N-methyltransferase
MDIIALLVFFLGTFFGSFFNVVIYRLPIKKSIVYGSSSCPSCDTPIKPYDLIPVFSYLFLRGKCRSCHHKISMRYPLIELLTGILYMLVYLQFGLTAQFGLGIVLMSVLIIVAMIDIDTMEIYDTFHIIILALGLINLFVSDVHFINYIIGFFIISIPFFIIAYFTGGMGGGDIKLIAVAGFLLGYPSTIVAFLIASISGGIVAVVLLLQKKETRKSMIAFGPFLCIGIALAYLYGPQLIDWYLTLIIS